MLSRKRSYAPWAAPIAAEPSGCPAEATPGIRKSGPVLGSAPGGAGPPRRRVARRAAALRYEAFRDGVVLAARADHAHRVPRVDDLVLALGNEAQAPIDGRAAVVAVHGDGEHVPLRVVHARREGPAPGDDEAAV